MPDSVLPQHRWHPRQFEQNRFVYPVLSRRSRGISIGVNLNPDKICNFDCIYCQVDRRSEAETRFVETEQLFGELDAMFDYCASGEIFKDPRFASVPPELQRVNDIAFSGDGEPTTYRNFDTLIGQVAERKRAHGLDAVKMVLITNASMFHRPVVQRGLEILDENNGEIWAKLEAGTAEYFQLVDRTRIPFQQILDNITAAAQKRPLVIQSLFMRVNGEPPSQEEFDAFLDRLSEIQTAGGQLRLVQVYTVARTPAESFVQPLTNSEVDAMAAAVTERTGIPAERYYGAS
ncbi:Radical SAM superfamily protein [Maioricimonas rarisocia]|uniref:Radical SAM superfamily protein n=1 Tax=Maioricimonas rarisocia TaxID=2528026 RepID=A0A517Z6Q0_9PLAN|nr:radical SAM protein [Maioricimonas rarisocia]QDU38163.1 Radical SAM superfamily protein [Maioricimonas rarisocia]